MPLISMPHGMYPNKNMPDLSAVSEIYWVSRLYELLQAEKTINMSLVMLYHGTQPGVAC